MVSMGGCLRAEGSASNPVITAHHPAITRESMPSLELDVGF